MACKIEVCVKKRGQEYYAEIECPEGVDETLSPQELCLIAVKNSLQTQTHKKLLEGIIAETDEALFAVFDYIYNEITKPLIDNTPKYAECFSAEYPKIIRSKSVSFKRKAQMMKFLVNNTEKGELND